MDNSKKYCLQVFEGEIKICTAVFPKDFSVETKRFSPLPDESIVFFFEACHTKVSQKDNFHFNPMAYPQSEISLKLVWKSSTKIYSFLIMTVDVKICFYDGSVFHNYEPATDIKVDQMGFIPFPKVPFYPRQQQETLYNSIRVQNPSKPSIKMKNGLNLVFKMTFKSDTPPAIPHSPNFSTNLKSVYESSIFHDFIIKVGDATFPVHKVFLAAHSPVFKNMLTHDCRESKSNSVTIEDSTPDVFELFLKYLYLGVIGNKSWATVRDLYGLADKYDVQCLKRDCGELIIYLMSIDLICEILKIAYLYDDSNLKVSAKQFAVSHIKELISKKEWNNLVATHPTIGYEVVVNFVPV